MMVTAGNGTISRGRMRTGDSTTLHPLQYAHTLVRTRSELPNCVDEVAMDTAGG